MPRHSVHRVVGRDAITVAVAVAVARAKLSRSPSPCRFRPRRFLLDTFPETFPFSPRLAREGGEQRGKARGTRRPARCEVGIDRSARSRVGRGRGVLALRSRSRGAFSLNPVPWKPMGTARSSSRTRLRSMRKTRTERSSIGVSERRRSMEGRHVPPPSPPSPPPPRPPRPSTGGGSVALVVVLGTFSPTTQRA